EAVTESIAAFTRAERDTRRREHRIAQRRRVFIFEQFLRQNRDRLRLIDYRFGEFRRGKAGRHIRRRRICVGVGVRRDSWLLLGYRRSLGILLTALLRAAQCGTSALLIGGELRRRLRARGWRIDGDRIERRLL